MAGKVRQIVLGSVVGLSAGAAAGGLFYMAANPGPDTLTACLATGSGVGLLSGAGYGAYRAGKKNEGDIEIEKSDLGFLPPSIAAFPSKSGGRTSIEVRAVVLHLQF